MANISKIDRRAEKEKQQAAKNRREIVAAGLSRREMLRLGLLTSAGLLIPMSGLSVRARSSAGRLFDSGSGSGPNSPPTRPFVQPFTHDGETTERGVESGADHSAEHRRR